MIVGAGRKHFPMSLIKVFLPDKVRKRPVFVKIVLGNQMLDRGG